MAFCSSSFSHYGRAWFCLSFQAEIKFIIIIMCNLFQAMFGMEIISQNHGPFKNQILLSWKSRNWNSCYPNLFFKNIKIENNSIVRKNSNNFFKKGNSCYVVFHWNAKKKSETIKHIFFQFFYFFVGWKKNIVSQVSKSFFFLVFPLLNMKQFCNF